MFESDVDISYREIAVQVLVAAVVVVVVVVVEVHFGC
jgi:hypothetical protein